MCSFLYLALDSLLGEDGSSIQAVTDVPRVSDQSHVTPLKHRKEKKMRKVQEHNGDTDSSWEPASPLPQHLHPNILGNINFMIQIYMLELFVFEQHYSFLKSGHHSEDGFMNSVSLLRL